MKLEIKTTERGFLHADFKDHYNRDCCIESHNINQETLVSIGAWPVNVSGELRNLYLTQEMAGELAKQLAYFARNGKLKEKQIKSLSTYLCSYPDNKTSKTYYLELIKSNHYSNAIKYAKEKYPDKAQYFNNDKNNVNILRLVKEKEGFLASKNLIKWLSEGQQGFYTPNGLVKEL